jgi:hypothetical protein
MPRKIIRVPIATGGKAEAKEKLGATKLICP